MKDVWKACGKQGSSIRNRRNELIATVNWRGRANHSPLIAAAPELYEALKQLVYECRNEGWGTLSDGSPDPFLAAADTALAKARGEQ